MLDDAAMKQCALGYSVIVPWGELTSSKLLAQSYEKAGKRARLPTTKPRKKPEKVLELFDFKDYLSSPSPSTNSLTPLPGATMGTTMSLGSMATSMT